MGDRVVDCARLESVCAERHRGFESLPIRQLEDNGIIPSARFRSLLFPAIASFQNLELLTQFQNAAFRQHAAKVYVRINETIAPEK